MAVLTEVQRNLMWIIKRSLAKADADGWCKVSAAVWPLAKTAHLPDLVELDQMEVGGRLRLTERGKIVMEYLL